MKSNKLTLGICVFVLCVALLGCSTGQFLGPKSTPTAAPTPTPTAVPFDPLQIVLDAGFTHDSTNEGYCSTSCTIYANGDKDVKFYDNGSISFNQIAPQISTTTYTSLLEKIYGPLVAIWVERNMPDTNHLGVPVSANIEGYGSPTGYKVGIVLGQPINDLILVILITPLK